MIGEHIILLAPSEGKSVEEERQFLLTLKILIREFMCNVL
jgi:hypothetical protein